MTRAAHRLTATICVLFLLALLALALREITISSKFQLFGELVLRVDTRDKVVALTFDDGPHPTRTVLMLDLLDRHGVQATFFMMGRNIERHPDVAREVVRRGHQVGNHSYSHPKMIWMTPAAVRDEIERTDDLLRSVGARDPIAFRAPHGVELLVLPYVLTRMGRTNIQGDVDPEEWTGRSAEEMTVSVLKQVRPGSIIGFHDTSGARTLAAVDAVLTRLLADGYRFERLSDLLLSRASD